jgi:hypothetical protein
MAASSPEQREDEREDRMIAALTARQAATCHPLSRASRLARQMLPGVMSTTSVTAAAGRGHARRVEWRIAALIRSQAATPAVIGLALAYGAAALLRAGAGAVSIALATTGLAISGFFVELSFAVRAGDGISIAYHPTLLPLLPPTVGAQLRDGDRS